MQKVALGAHWRSSNAASLCSPMAQDVSRDMKTFWLKGGRNQSCHKALQERQPTIELGLCLLSLSEGHELQSWCSRDKHTAENAPEKGFKLFFFPHFSFLIHILILFLNGVASLKQCIHISNECDPFGANVIFFDYLLLTQVLEECSSSTQMWGNTESYCFIYILLGKLSKPLYYNIWQQCQQHFPGLLLNILLLFVFHVLVLLICSY